MSLLKDKVAVITGSGSGIGQGIAVEYAGQGAKIVISDINEKGMGKTLNMVEEAGGEATTIKADVKKVEDIDALMSGAVEKFGRIDILVNNAGVGLPNVVEFTEDSVIDHVLDINVKGVIRCTKRVIPEMKKNGDDGGVIVNLASIKGLIGTQMLSLYASSKHAVIGFTRSTAMELAQYKIRVNAICPGSIDTPMMVVAASNKEMRKKIEDHTPMARMGTPKDIAGVAVFLASDLARFVNGTYVVVDGGQIAGIFDLPPI